MASTINFLPWREARRAACLHFWALMFGGALLLAGGVTVSRYLVKSAETRVGSVLLQAEQQRATALQASRAGLQKRQQQRQQALLQRQQREQTREWQSVLQELAALLPEQAWLTKITYQQETLALSGLAINVNALAAFETSLRRHAAFQLTHRGATQQDAQGYWQFAWQLTRRSGHEHAQ